MIVIAIIGILATGLIPALGNYFDRAYDASKVSDMGNIARGINAYFIDHDSYSITGQVGWSGTSQGWANYVNGTSYLKSMSDTLKESGYLPPDFKTLTVTDLYKDKIITNAAPCVISGVSQDLFMYYWSDATGKYSLSSYLHYPKDSHLANILTSYNGSGSNGTCTKYGMNYSVNN